MCQRLSLTRAASCRRYAEASQWHVILFTCIYPMTNDLRSLTCSCVSLSRERSALPSHWSAFVILWQKQQHLPHMTCYLVRLVQYWTMRAKLFSHSRLR